MNFFNYLFVVGHPFQEVLDPRTGKHQKSVDEDCLVYKLSKKSVMYPAAFITGGVHFIHLCNPTKGLRDFGEHQEVDEDSLIHFQMAAEIPSESDSDSEEQEEEEPQDSGPSNKRKRKGSRGSASKKRQRTTKTQALLSALQDPTTCHFEGITIEGMRKLNFQRAKYIHNYETCDMFMLNKYDHC